MCKSKAEGGARCAAHTRWEYLGVLAAIRSESDPRQRIVAQAEGRAAVVAHGTTRAGAGEIEEVRVRFGADGDADMVAYLSECQREADVIRQEVADREAEIERVLAAREKAVRPVAEDAQAEPVALEPADVTVGRADAAGLHPVVTRSGRRSVGAVTAMVGPDGKKAWVPTTEDGTPLTYPVPGPDGEPVARRYAKRAQAVQAVLNQHNTGGDPAARWSGAPAYDWTQQTYGFWGRTFTVGETLRDRPLLHGSPHELEVGAVLVPDQAPVNFTQSDPFVVSVTTESRLAHHWAQDAVQNRTGGGTYYVYEVEPLTKVSAWNWNMDGWNLRQSPPVPDPDHARLVLDEGRVGAARIVAVHRYDAGM